MPRLVPMTESNTFDALDALTREALDPLLGKRPRIRAPWWIHKGKSVFAGVASTRTQLLSTTLEALSKVSLSSDCHGPALA